MSIDAFTLFQRCDDLSPGRAGFGVEGGRAEELYISRDSVTAQEIKDALLEILGDVSIGPGYLIRTLPKAHPMFPWLLASSVEIQGVGHQDTRLGETSVEVEVEDGDIRESSSMTDSYLQYVKTQLKVSFTPRPYALIDDDAITAEEITWTKPDGTTETAVDSHEYERFTDQELDDNPQIATAQHGQMWFRTSGEEPEGYPFSGHPYTILPDGEFRLIWYQVPYTIFLDSTHPMRRFVGHVNQSEFFDQPAGSLLYMGAKARRYTPCVPAYRLVGSKIGYSSEKLCDITFRFAWTSRTTDAPPDTGNANWIASGHNIMPYWKFREFFYIANKADDMRPLFYSAPMQLLFSTGEMEDEPV